MLAAALDTGCRRIVLGIGGSACTDGGSGMLSALGARITDARGGPLPDGGAALVGASALDLSRLHPRIMEAEIVVACDVDNPLLGPHGAAAVYGPQKGANGDDLATLEMGLIRWAALVADVSGLDRASEPGAGAAGGVGFAAMAVLGARLRPGFELVGELIGFPAALAGAELVVTGEGSLDHQTLHGKAPARVAAAAGRAAVPVVAVAGRVELAPDTLRAAGFTGVYTLVETASDPRQCFTRPGPLFERIGGRIAAEHLRVG